MQILPKTSTWARSQRRASPLALLTACLAVSSIVASCGPTTDEVANEVVVALENPPIHFDPRVATDQSSARVFELVLNGLVDKLPNGDLAPCLAESWEILEGGKRYRFSLRDDVKFHDGRDFSADDVAWTFQTMLDGRVVTPKAGALAQLAGVEVVDPKTVDFVMHEPFGAMLANLTTYIGIIPNGEDPDAMNAQLIGTGAFRFADSDSERVTLEAFDGAWQGRPNLDRVILKQVPDATVRELELRKGSTSLVVNGLAPDVISRFRADKSFRVAVDPGSNWSYLGLNLREGPLAELRVRQAILRAVDRHQIVDSLWQGLGRVGESPIPEGHWAHHTALDPVPFDLAAARELLDAAGYPDPDGEGDGVRFSLTYKTSTDQTAVLKAQAIQSMLARVGIGVDVRSYEFATFYNDVKQGNFEMFSLTQTGIIDPDIFALMLHSRSVPPGGFNRGGYSNEAFDRAIDAGATATTPATRLPHYLIAQEIFARDVPFVSIMSKMTVAVMPATLEGYENYLSGELYSLRKARWSADG